MREMNAMERLRVHAEDLEAGRLQAQADGDKMREAGCTVAGATCEIAVADLEAGDVDKVRDAINFLREAEGKLALQASLSSDQEAMVAVQIFIEARRFIQEAVR